MTLPIFDTSKDPKEKAAGYISDVLKNHLGAGEKVLFLIPGGSAVLVLPILEKMLEGVDCSNLSVTLTDERYGNVGHKDSNWSQIIESGFKLAGATLYPVLSGKDEMETVSDFDKTLRNLFQSSDYVIGLFGIGQDGHTSGILPHSKAVDSDDFVCGYQAEDYYRITTTPKALENLDEAVIYASGVSKRNALEKLKTDYPVKEEPAQVLKQADKFIIFND